MALTAMALARLQGILVIIVLVRPVLTFITRRIALASMQRILKFTLLDRPLMIGSTNRRIALVSLYPMLATTLFIPRAFTPLVHQNTTPSTLLVHPNTTPTPKTIATPASKNRRSSKAPPISGRSCRLPTLFTRTRSIKPCQNTNHSSRLRLILPPKPQRRLARISSPLFSTPPTLLPS